MTTRKQTTRVTAIRYMQPHSAAILPLLKLPKALTNRLLPTVTVHLLSFAAV